MKSTCHWCGEAVKPGRKFCCYEHRRQMKMELMWYATRESQPRSRITMSQYIVFTTTPHWRQLQPWQYDRLEFLGYQKRTFLHE